VATLGDVTTDARLLLLTARAVVVGTMGALVACALVWLIGLVTNAVYYHRFSTELVSPVANALGWWPVLVPTIGGLAIGPMARFGSEKIRGHGISEAMEAILIGREERAREG